MKHLQINTSAYRHLFHKYEEWLQIEKYMPLTVDSYSQSLQEFFHYLEAKGICQLHSIQQEHFTRFKNYLQVRKNYILNSSGIRNITVNAIVKGVNCFVKHLNATSEYFKLDIYEVYLPVDVKEKHILNQSEVMELYNATFENYKNGSIEMGQRDRVMLAIFYGCGLRLNEGRNLNISDIDFQNKRILVRFGKKKKERYVPIPNKHLADIQTYIQHGREWFRHHHYNSTCFKRSIRKVVPKADEDALFLNIKGRRMIGFGHRFEFLREMTSIDAHFSTHTLRHSLATHLLQKGLKLEKISKLLGHSSIDSTQVYVHIVEQLKHQKDESF